MITEAIKIFEEKVFDKKTLISYPDVVIVQS